jgi:TP901 family phage tail tape measure protein
MATVAKLNVQISATINGLEGSLKKAESGLNNFAKNATAIGSTLSKSLTLPLVGLGTTATTLAIGFDTSMSKITALVGIAADEVNGMKEAVLKLSGETAKSPKELADALFVVTSAGLRGKEALSALEQSAKAGAAGLGETTDIARALAGAMNAYGPSVVSAARATDMIVATARAGNFETSQFAGAIGQVLPFAKQVGASLEDMGGAVALLTRTNGDAAQSVTQVASLFRAFVVPTAEAKKALDDVGLSASDFRKAISEQGLPAALKMLDNSLGGNREQLGRLLGSSEAAAAAFQILDADAQTIADTFGAVNNAVGITDEAFDIVADTAGFKIQQAFVGLKNSLMEFGDIISPFVEQLAGMVSKLVTFFKELDSGTKKFILILGAIAAAIGPVVFAFGLLAKAFALVKTVAFAGGLLVKGLAVAFGLLAKAVTFVLSPIFLKIAAIVAIGVAINTLLHNLKPLGERFMYYFGIAKNAVIEMAASALNALGELVSYANATAGGALKGLAESMRSLKGEIEDPANMTPFVGPLESLGDTFSILKDKVLGYVDSLSKASTGIDTLSKKSEDVTAPTFASSGGGIESADMGTAPTFAFSGRPLESADMGTEGELKVRTVDTETYANAVGYLGSRLNEVAVNTSAINMQTEQMSVGFELLKPLSDEFVNSFAQGMANVVMQGEKLQDMLKNIGKMLLSSAIQTGIKLLLSGGLSSAGEGFFGSGGGLFGSIFGVNDALIQSNGNIVKFHPDDNILAMKDFSNLGGGGGGGSVKVQMVASPVRITNKEIVFAFTQGQTDWSR